MKTMINDRVEAILGKYEKEGQCWILQNIKGSPTSVDIYRVCGGNATGARAVISAYQMEINGIGSHVAYLTDAETRMLVDVQQTIKAIVSDEDAQHRAAERAAENLVKTAGTVQQLIDELRVLPPVVHLTLAVSSSIQLTASNPPCGDSVLCLGERGLFVNLRTAPISLSVVDEESSYVDLRLMQVPVAETLRLQFWFHSLATGENVPLRIEQPN